ncbi:helix-turn-helix domain-containing protein [Microbacterium lacticum]
MARVPSPAAAHIGERIRVAREGVRMTHDQLAAAMGIDSANIRSYESGRAMPKSC